MKGEDKFGRQEESLVHFGGNLGVTKDKADAVGGIPISDQPTTHHAFSISMLPLSLSLLSLTSHFLGFHWALP